MKKELLKNIGLTNSEIKTYLCLLELDSASATQIAQKTEMYRKNTYDALYGLIEKGLVSFAKLENKRIFKAADPQRLLQFIEIQKKELQEVLPELKTLYHAAPLPEEITIFKGVEGLKTIFEDIITSHRKYDEFGAGEMFKHMLPYYYPQFHKKKEENNILSRALYSHSEVDSRFIRELGLSVDVRFLLQDFASAATTIIYGSKVAIIVWSERPTGILISSGKAADCFKQYFNALWTVSLAVPSSPRPNPNPSPRATIQALKDKTSRKSIDHIASPVPKKNARTTTSAKQPRSSRGRTKRK